MKYEDEIQTLRQFTTQNEGRQLNYYVHEQRKWINNIFKSFIVFSLLFLSGCVLKKEVDIKPCAITQNYIDLPKDKECNEYKKEDKSGIGPDTTKLVFQIKDVKIEDILPQVTVEINEKASFDKTLFNFFDDTKINEAKGPYKEKYILKDDIAGVYVIQIEDTLYGMIQKQT